MLPVKCNQHPWMRMYINVVKSPFYAVTGPDGKYEIKGLPPGDYTIAFVQEKLGEQTQKVTVAAKDSKTVDQSFKAAVSGRSAEGGGHFANVGTAALGCPSLERARSCRTRSRLCKSLATPYNRAHHRFAVFSRARDFLPAHRRSAGYQQRRRPLGSRLADFVRIDLQNSTHGRRRALRAHPSHDC